MRGQRLPGQHQHIVEVARHLPPGRAPADLRHLHRLAHAATVDHRVDILGLVVDVAAPARVARAGAAVEGPVGQVDTVQPAGAPCLLGDPRRREPQSLEPVADQSARLLGADQEGEDTDRADLAPRPRVGHHGLTAERAGAGKAGRLEGEVGPAGAAFGRDLLARRGLAGSGAQGRVERGLDDLDRRLGDLVAMPAIGADQLGRAGRVGEHRPALVAGELAQMRRGNPYPALGPLVLFGPQPTPGPGAHRLRRHRESAAAPR